MNGLEQRTHRTVTERLADRLDDVEPVVDRLLQNEAKLIADAVQLQGYATSIADAHMKSYERIERLTSELDAARGDIAMLTHRLVILVERYDSEHLVPLGTFRQRLSWLLFGGA